MWPLKVRPRHITWSTKVGGPRLKRNSAKLSPFFICNISVTDLGPLGRFLRESYNNSVSYYLKPHVQHIAKDPSCILIRYCLLDFVISHKWSADMITVEPIGAETPAEYSAPSTPRAGSTMSTQRTESASSTRTAESIVSSPREESIVPTPSEESNYSSPLEEKDQVRHYK